MLYELQPLHYQQVIVRCSLNCEFKLISMATVTQLSYFGCHRFPLSGHITNSNRSTETGPLFSVQTQLGYLTKLINHKPVTNLVTVQTITNQNQRLVFVSNNKLGHVSELTNHRLLIIVHAEHEPAVNDILQYNTSNVTTLKHDYSVHKSRFQYRFHYKITWLSSVATSKHL